MAAAVVPSLGAADCTRVEAWRGSLATALGKAAAGSVARDPTLEALAARRAADAAGRGRLDHEGLAEAVASAGLERCRVSELLAIGPAAGPEGLLARWRASPEHAARLADPGYERHGLGLACPADAPPMQALILAGPCIP